MKLPWKPPLPSAFELAQMAASARFKAHNPSDAIEQALIMWMEGVKLLVHLANDPKIFGYTQDYERMVESMRKWRFDNEKTAREALARQKHPDNAPLRLGSSENDSEAMHYLLANASNKRDQFKSFAKFKSAWVDENAWPKDDIENPRTTVAEVKAFIKAREDERRYKGARGARERREKANSGKRQKKSKYNFAQRLSDELRKQSEKSRNRRKFARQTGRK